MPNKHYEILVLRTINYVSTIKCRYNLVTREKTCNMSVYNKKNVNAVKLLRITSQLSKPMPETEVIYERFLDSQV